MATQAWPMVKTVEEPLALITHPVTALLSEIASYVIDILPGGDLSVKEEC